MATKKFLEKALSLKNDHTGVEMPTPLSHNVLKNDDYYDVSEMLLTLPRDLILCLLLPVFAIDKRDKNNYEYFSADGRHSVKVFADAEVGRATMYDKEYLLYAIGIIQDMIDKKIINREAKNRPLLIDASQMLHDIHRVDTDKRIISANKDIWNKLLQAGRRLQATRIELHSAGANKSRSVQLTQFINDFSLVQDSTGKVTLKIELRDWLWKAIMAQKPADILSLENDYWDMTPFQRRIYEIIRINMGIKNSRGNATHDIHVWKYDELRKLCGIRTSRNFITNLKEVFDVKTADGEACDNAFRKAKKRTGLPKVWGNFHLWVAGFHPDKLVIMKRELLKIPHKPKTDK